MVKIKIYVEGGGDRKDLRERCREGFSKFLEKAGLRGRMPAVVACGSRQSAYDRFCTAVSTAGRDDVPLLLVDSEDAVNESPWTHLRTCSGWVCPSGADGQQVHLMVQIMESWFLADRSALANYFGSDFHDSALPANTRIEKIAKRKVFDSLRQATRDCGRDKVYDESAKGRHSFALLGKIDPQKVRAASPHAERLLNTLENASR